MKNLHLSTWMLGLALLTASGCSSEDSPETPEPTPEPVPGQIPITLHCGIADIVSKATDTAFEAGDRIGLYVVNYDGDTAGSLPLYAVALLDDADVFEGQAFVVEKKWTRYVRMRKG